MALSLSTFKNQIGSKYYCFLVDKIWLDNYTKDFNIWYVMIKLRNNASFLRMHNEYILIVKICKVQTFLMKQNCPYTITSKLSVWIVDMAS